jgi:general secretion pathway protein E
MTRTREICERLQGLDSKGSDYATRFVELILEGARASAASDLHLQPTLDGLDVRWRLDGVLQPVGVFKSGEMTDVVTRLKVLAGLLTYQVDLPQEGRIHVSQGDVEMRVSTFPTLHGERAVIRLFAAEHPFLHLTDLGFSEPIDAAVRRMLLETSGVLIIAGPAGSGKTTTAYACLREIVEDSAGGKSVVSLEDPIEMAVSGVAQSQVNAHSGFTLATGLKSLVRQDPEVVMLGEIRDPETAETVFQAALTGHLIITTFHAGSAAVAVSRLGDMGIEPYLLRSGVLGILSQRLLRRLCKCRRPLSEEAQKLGLPVQGGFEPVGCAACRHTGYAGRFVLAELLRADHSEIGRAILSRDDATVLDNLAQQTGMVPNRQLALEAVEKGDTSPAEVRRVFGFSV